MSEMFPDIVGYEENQRSRRTPGANVSRVEELWKGRSSGGETTSGANAYTLDNPAPKAGKGGGGMSAIDRYTRALQRMLKGQYRQPYDDLTNRLNTMGQQAESTIGSSMDQLQSFLQGQANPYQGFKAQQTQVEPALAGLLQSQGVATNPLQEFAGTINAQNAGQSTAFQNLADTLGQLYGTQQTGMVQDAAQNRANLQSQLAAARMGMGAQINQQAAGQQSQLMQLLLDAISKGGRPGAGRLF